MERSTRNVARSLTPLGEKRAELLVKWFQDRGLLPGITHVFATHKARSLQTVAGIAVQRA